MIGRARRETVRFLHPATIAGVDHELAAGDYEVVIEEELIEGLSFASYRRVATLITVPSASMRAVEMVPIESTALAAAQHRDAVTAQGLAQSAATIAPHER